MLNVMDYIAIVEELIKLGVSEPGRQIIQGGSHGDFLAAHCKLSPSQADSTRFIKDPAIMCNPVILAGKLCTSDISNWAFCKFGLPFGPGTHITPDTFAALYVASLSVHVDHVTRKVRIIWG